MATAESHEESRQPLIMNRVGDGSTSLWGKPVERARTGAWKAAPFIYVLIFADTIAVLGIAGNLVTYAYGTLHLSIAESANTVTNFMGFTFLIPIFWGFLADSYFGRFWIITFGCVSACMGLVFLTLSTALPSLRPPSCTPTEDVPVCPTASQFVLTWFYAALYLISVGSAAIKPCMLSMGQDQFDETDPEEKKQGASFFTGYYVVLNGYSIFCVTVLFYIQSSISFTVGYGCISIMFFVTVCIFFLGSPFYRHVKPMSSPLTRAAEVLVAAARNFSQPLPADPQDLYEVKHGKGQLLHTPRLRCLDKAAIVKSPDVVGKRWKVCTVTQVEELKGVLQILPIWVCIVLVFTLYAQVMGVGVQQAATLDRRLGPHFTIPPGTSAVMLMISGVAFAAIYQYLLLPVLHKLTGDPQGLSPLRKIAVALLLAIAAMVVAAKIEDRRVRIIQEQDNTSFLFSSEQGHAQVPMSVFWLLPQFFFLGCVEILLGVAQLHFLYKETPDSMRSLAVSLTFATIAVGYFVSSGLVNAVNKFSASTGGWLADEFDTGGLRKYYYLLAIIMAVDLVIFLVLSHTYTYKSTIQSQAVGSRSDSHEGRRDTNLS